MLGRSGKAQRGLFASTAGIAGASTAAGGVTLAEYIGSAPPEDTGFHRYAFLLFAQDPAKEGKFSLEPLKYAAEGRGGFDVAGFAKDNSLALLAANYYICQNPGGEHEDATMIGKVCTRSWARPTR